MLEIENRVFVSGDVAVIEIYNKKMDRYFYTLVDSEDVDFIRSQVKTFNLFVDRYTTYVNCNTNKGSIGLHRLILNTPPGLIGDHINHNGLDNRKKNIRSVTQSVNNSYRGNRRKKPPINEMYVVKQNLLPPWMRCTVV